MQLREINTDKPIHMVGIGGTSMSGIADILVQMGYSVTGSDRTASHITEKLINNGIQVHIGHQAQNVEGAGLVVYTAAIAKDNPELTHAKELGIPCMERAELLGEITRLYDETISICGTHGKTSTTSMISLAFLEAGKDPTIQVGAEIRQLGDLNYRVGSSPYMVVESCEYVRSFLHFHPKTAVLLNIEEDHLDYYKDLADICSAFRDFVSLVPQDGTVIVNADNENCLEVVSQAKGKVITFGIQNISANFVATNIQVDANGFYYYDVCFDGQKYPIQLHVPGYHHVYNSLATIATGITYGISISVLQKALLDYTGASRRFEYVGEYHQARIFDDYAHHPTEVKTTIDAATKMPHNKLWVVFQPHTYSRTKALFPEFVDAFAQADTLILLDIYAAREPLDETISSQMLANAIQDKYKNVIYMPTIEEATTYLKNHLQPNDLLLTLGAGTVTEIGYDLIQK